MKPSIKIIRNIFTVSLVALSLLSCAKNYLDISDHPFDISTPKIEANRVVVDVIPDNNDFYYMFGVVAAETFEAVGQAAFIDLVDNFSKSTYKILFETTSLDKYLEWMYRGAYDEVNHDLEPDTRYIVFAFPYNGLTPDAGRFTKVEFKTPAIVKSDNVFSVSIDGSVISVTPSNNDTYFFDYCSKDDLNDYYSSIDFFYRKSIDIYWEYGFLDTFIAKGPSSEDIRDYYAEMVEGDIFYMAISGYNQGITTDVTYYKITVHLDGKTKSTIEVVPDFTMDSTQSSLFSRDNSPSKATTLKPLFSGKTNTLTPVQKHIRDKMFKLRVV